jgi:hypothetical protein
MAEFFTNAVAGFFIGLILAAIFSVAGLDAMNRSEINSRWQKEAIERDYGEYCSKTGKWTWAGECE